MKRFLILALALIPLRSLAVVDMKNANYADAFVDISLPSTGGSGGIDLRVQRFYNSRSVFIGIFGYGWCSDFETVLEKTPEGTLKLQECGAGQEVTYSQKSGSGDVDKTVDSILAFAKKSNPAVNEKYLSELKEQVTNNVSLRTRWARQAGMAIPEVKKGTVYSADTLEVEQITFDGTHYIRNLSDGTSQRFDPSGRLVYIYERNGNYLKMTYTNDQLKEIVDNSGRKLTFSFYPNKRAKEIIGPNGLKVEYKFKGEDLSEVKNMWKNTYTYAYDDNHNLTKINFPDGTFKALTYNPKNDWVMSFTDRAANNVACTETYTYEVDKSNPKDHFWSTATKKCGKEIKNQARFEFWFRKRADGRKYLSRVLTKSMNETMDVTYHPEFGRPLSIKKGTITTTFSYYPNGLIKEKSTAASRLVYEYKNSFNKVSKVAADFFDNVGKVVKKRETTFTYDNKGNLTFAQNTDGQTVRLAYDNRGRIASIVDQAKKEVLIKYDERTGKPATITRPKVGTITVTYKANNEIKKVESKDGPTVAVQVASTFNNLLDIIAPATSELNL